VGHTRVFEIDVVFRDPRMPAWFTRVLSRPNVFAAPLTKAGHAASVLVAWEIAERTGREIAHIVND